MCCSVVVDKYESMEINKNGWYFSNWYCCGINMLIIILMMIITINILKL